ncbi:hypothetical protein TURU_023562 [Turdus rufiventris]|nr:hypothetical protein TURU_023562 [Turdus rufiventris]
MANTTGAESICREVNTDFSELTPLKITVAYQCWRRFAGTYDAERVIDLSEEKGDQAHLQKTRDGTTSSQTNSEKERSLTQLSVDLKCDSNTSQNTEEKERIIEYPELEETHKGDQVQLLALCREQAQRPP